MAAKKEFKFFTIMEYEKEQEYLRQMHNSGWRFVRVTGLGMYHFESCAPEDVVYQLDYNKEGNAHKPEYVQLFADCGWEYIQEFFGYSYFRKQAELTNGREEIFCDDESRLQMMQRVFKGRLVPLLVIFCAVLLPQFVINLFVYNNLWVALLVGVVLGLYGSVFAAFAISYFRYKRGRET